MYITTEQLQNRLAHCYGKDTVTVTHYNGNNFIFHYNALICVINDQRVIFNIPYYDYSGATSSVRNRACEMILGKSWTTPELHRLETKFFKNTNAHFDFSNNEVNFAVLSDDRIYDYLSFTEKIGDMIMRGEYSLI